MRGPQRPKILGAAFPSCFCQKMTDMLDVRRLTKINQDGFHQCSMGARLRLRHLQAFFCTA